MRAAVFTSALVFCAAGAAQAWDPSGHMLVGEIAWRHCAPGTREAVAALVKPLEATYNEGREYNFVTAGCWMDDMRSKRGYKWGRWHYVTIPWSADGARFSLPAEGPHVVWAIGENVATLRDAAATPAQRTEALAMLVHFVGDVHQPLHCTDRGDRGGNGYLITGVPFTDLWPGTVANLHALWDKAFRFGAREGKVAELWPGPDLAGRPAAPGQGIIAEQAGKMIAEYPAESLAAEVAVLDAAAWARESHVAGCTAGYPAGEPPADNEVRAITADFAAASQKTAARRIVLAGLRLARLLDGVFAK